MPVLSHVPAAMLTAATLCLAACAPDAVSNYRARDFNAYLDALRRSCPNMVIGTNNISEWLRSGGASDQDNYVYWLDQTSRLYYKRITVADYRASITGAMGSGKEADRVLDCIVGHLPPNRPTNPPGSLLRLP